MKLLTVALTPALTFFAFTALAQEAAVPAAGPTPEATPPVAADVAPAPLPPPPVAATPLAPPELVAPPPAPVVASAVGDDGNPLAGWHNGVFYLRDTTDNFRLYIQGRAQVDFYSYAGPGVADVATLKPTLFLRRIRPEIGGELFKSWWFSIAGDFGATNQDNRTGNSTETVAAPPGTDPTAATARYAGAQTSRISAAPTDVFLNYRAHPLFNVQVGQYDAPFTMENRTSDKYIPFMERSLAVRDVGIPTNKDIGVMLWGEMKDKYWFYSAGLFNGEGQNRLNTDSRGDVMMRTFVHPMASDKSELKDLQIGGSLRYGSRDTKWTNYDYPGMSTQGGYTFWSPTYTGSGGVTHIIPSGNQFGLAGELRVPISMVDLTSEVVYINNHTREASDGLEGSGTSLRRGGIKGVSYYIQAGVWLGKRDVNGLPGYENMTHVDFSKADGPPANSVQLLAKWEQLHLKYDSADRAGTMDVKNIDGDIKVNAFSLGVNYWATKHIRLTANYVLNMFPDSAPTSQTVKGTGPVQSASNRAIAPGNTLGAGVNNDARDNAHSLNEFLLRCAVAL